MLDIEEYKKAMDMPSISGVLNLLKEINEDDSFFITISTIKDDTIYNFSGLGKDFHPINMGRALNLHLVGAKDYCKKYVKVVQHDKKPCGNWWNYLKSILGFK